VGNSSFLLVERALEFWDLHIVDSYRAQPENYTDWCRENDPDSSSLSPIGNEIDWSKGHKERCLGVNLVLAIVIHVILRDDIRLNSKAVVDTSSRNIYIGVFYDYSPKSLNVRIVISTIKHRDIVEIRSCTWASLATRTHNRNFANIASTVSIVLARREDFGSKISGTLLICPWKEHVIWEIYIKDCFIGHISTWNNTNFNEGRSTNKGLINRDCLNYCLFSY
jgi:hypothetical protein